MIEFGELFGVELGLEQLEDQGQVELLHCELLGDQGRAELHVLQAELGQSPVSVELGLKQLGDQVEGGFPGDLPQTVPIKFPTFSMKFSYSLLFQSVLEYSKMFNPYFHLYKVFYAFIYADPRWISLKKGTQF